MNKINRPIIGLAALLGLAGLAEINASAQTPVAIPPSYAMPAGSVNTNEPGFRVRAYQTDAAHGGNVAWAEDQLAGLHGTNVADLSSADADGYFTINTSAPLNPSGLVNWNISSGNVIDNFYPADPFPGIPGLGIDPTENFTEEVLTYLDFPKAGTYTLGVNSDDGFALGVTSLNPKDRFSEITLGEFNGNRGSDDTLFQVSVSQAGIYPFRLLYWQAGGGAVLDWFNVVTNSTSTNYVLIDDTATPGALKAYATAKIAPPYVTKFVHSPAGFTVTIQDDVSALDTNSVQVQLNGATVSASTSKSGSTTTVSYAAPTLFAPGATNNITIQYSDDAQPANQRSANFTFVVPSYTVLPSGDALTSNDVDTSQRGFLCRVSQIDSSAGIFGANVDHAEAQLAGLLIDPSTGTPYVSSASPGPQPDGSYVLNGVINFSFDISSEQGLFNTANGYPDDPFPGVNGFDSDNMAGEIVTYLDLKAGFYTFAVNGTDGFRVTTAANPYDPLGTTLGLFDFRGDTHETQFGVAVQKAGIYPIRLVWFGVAPGNASLELYTVNSDGSKVLVNDTNNPTAVKAYWKRTADYGTFVKYAGPSAFASPFLDSADVGFTNVTINISDGSTSKVDAASVKLAVDGSTISNATVNAAGGLTTLSYVPEGLQLPRTVHSAVLTYKDQNGTSHSDSWKFDMLRNYVLPAPLYYQDFESTSVGVTPEVPSGWVQENHTTVLNNTNDYTDLHSDYYLGWVVVDTSFNITKDSGLSTYSPQVLNGVAFDPNTNPLLVNHYMRAESDVRGGSQIQYVTTKSYDLSGKTGIVIAFDSAYEQNQDNIDGLEYTVDGTNWNPVFYWLQGNVAGDPSDIVRDGVGNIDVAATMLTPHGDVATYNSGTGQVIGGYYGAFIKAPITQALASHIEGRINDDSSESKRIELYRVPLADNQKSVKFRFLQAGTASWYWAVDNWGVYSVPSQVITPPSGGSPDLTITRSGNQVTISWPGSVTGFRLQSSPTEGTPSWTDVQGVSNNSITVTVGNQSQYYRLTQ